MEADSSGARGVRRWRVELELKVGKERKSRVESCVRGESASLPTMDLLRVAREVNKCTLGSV